MALRNTFTKRDITWSSSFAAFTIWEKAGIPYLKLFCPNHPSNIDVDEDILAELAVQHFQERGIRHFAYFSQCDLYWSNRRQYRLCHRADFPCPFQSSVHKKTGFYPNGISKTISDFGWSILISRRMYV
ncbi:MAG: hypothetical protein Q4D62_11290 [Planctomycetia bacterium]|nr:hypothetical protein [Planctomycetia bacterium]